MSYSGDNDIDIDELSRLFCLEVYHLELVYLHFMNRSWLADDFEGIFRKKHVNLSIRLQI